MQYRDFGKFLRQKRIARNPQVSLNHFSVETQIDSATLSKIERVKQGITLQYLSQIAEFYGVRVSKLIEEYELLNEKDRQI